MRYKELEIDIKLLRYDYDPSVNYERSGPTNSIFKELTELENHLPNIPPELLGLHRKRFPKIREVYLSIKKQGLVNPIVVTKVGSFYRVRIGNQRLCSLRALGYEGDVPCRVYPSLLVEKKDYVYIYGCEER